ncbi:MAG: ribosomal-processing cysteine protease Prp [Lachnospiraceae bacterium]|nr:ribosomal-processing cysteine protease Prp [Lachnospiraceae bacterium]
MTHLKFYRDSNDKLTGFECKGHAGYAEAGEDIVCAAISILTINFVNSVDLLTDSFPEVVEDEKKGYLKVTIKEYDKADVQLLFNSLSLGLDNIREEYPKFFDLTYDK